VGNLVLIKFVDSNFFFNISKQDNQLVLVVFEKPPRIRDFHERIRNKESIVLGG